MNQDVEYFGQTHDGEDVQAWVLENSSGLSVRLINYGAIVQSVRFPGKDGQQEEISLEEVEKNKESMPTEISSMAARSRVRPRRRSSYQPASFNPKVVGSA